MDPQKNASYGALISIILILAIVVIGAFYVWGERVKKNAPNYPQAATSTEQSF